MFDLAGFAGALLGDGRISGGFPVSLFPIDLSGTPFLDGELIFEETASPGAVLYLGDGRFNRDGLTLSSEPRAGERDEAVGGRVFEGRRSFETGCIYNSLLGGAQDEPLDAGLETLDTLDGARDGDRTGLAPLKKLDCRLTEAGEGGICASVSSVRSDNDGRIPRRPRTSCVDMTDAVSSSPASAELTSSDICVSSSPNWASSCLGGDRYEDGF